LLPAFLLGVSNETGKHGDADELIRALSRRYSEVRRIERSLLDEFVAVTGCHRKHAMRVLRDGCAGSRHGCGPAAVFTVTRFGKRSSCYGKPLIGSAVNG
jgi:hypothetical protein